MTINKNKMMDVLKRQSILLALILLIITASILYPEFLGAQNISNLLRQNSMVGLISIGMTFIILTGGIDLSVGAVASLSSVLAAILSPYGFAAAVFVPIIICTFIGLINGFVVTKMKIAPFIATLGMMMAIRGVSLVLTDGVSVAVSDDIGPYFGAISRGSLVGITVPAWIFLLTLVICMYVLKYTKIGRSVYALGGNAEAAKMMGLKPDNINLFVYSLNGFLSGLAGIILASRLTSGQPVGADGWEMTAIAAVAVGGTKLSGGKGGLWGTFIGILITGIISNMINLQGNINAWWQGIITGLILLIVVLIGSYSDSKKES